MEPCTKRRYPTIGAAQRALHAIRESASGRRRERSLYPCPHCHCWHLSSQRGRPKWRVSACDRSTAVDDLAGSGEQCADPLPVPAQRVKGSDVVRK